MIRCYVKPGDWAADEVDLDAAESAHLAGVLRVAPGATVGILDGAGHIGLATVLEAHKKHTRLRIVERADAAPRRPRRVLVQALIREHRMDWLIQKATELGVHEIHPMQTAHTIVQIKPPAVQKKLERWQAIALAACKQCGNPWLPEIAPPRSFAELAGRWSGGAACFGALQEGAEPLAGFLRSRRMADAEQVAAFIGPEGDFSAAEVQQLQAAGVRPVTFGRDVLRVETAALYMLSAIQYEWQAGEGP